MLGAKRDLYGTILMASLVPHSRRRLRGKQARLHLTDCTDLQRTASGPYILSQSEFLAHIVHFEPRLLPGLSMSASAFRRILTEDMRFLPARFELGLLTVGLRAALPLRPAPSLEDLELTRRFANVVRSMEPQWYPFYEGKARKGSTPVEEQFGSPMLDPWVLNVGEFRALASAYLSACGQFASHRCSWPPGCGSPLEGIFCCRVPFETWGGTGDIESLRAVVPIAGVALAFYLREAEGTDFDVDGLSVEYGRRVELDFEGLLDRTIGAWRTTQVRRPRSLRRGFTKNQYLRFHGILASAAVMESHSAGEPSATCGVPNLRARWKNGKQWSRQMFECASGSGPFPQMNACGSIQKLDEQYGWFLQSDEEEFKLWHDAVGRSRHAFFVLTVVRA